MKLGLGHAAILAGVAAHFSKPRCRKPAEGVEERPAKPGCRWRDVTRRAPSAGRGGEDRRRCPRGRSDSPRCKSCSPTTGAAAPHAAGRFGLPDRRGQARQPLQRPQSFLGFGGEALQRRSAGRGARADAGRDTALAAPHLHFPPARSRGRCALRHGAGGAQTDPKMTLGLYAQVIASKTDHGPALDGIVGASDWATGSDEGKSRAAVATA